MIFYKVAYDIDYEGEFGIVYFRDLSNAKDYCGSMNNTYPSNRYYIEEMQTQD